jgi:hypothetical protein
VSAIINGPKIKNQRDKLLISNRLKDIPLEHSSEVNKAALENLKMLSTKELENLKKLTTKELENSKKMAAQELEITKMMATNELENTKRMAEKDNELLEERLRSEQQEKSSLIAAHKSQIKSIEGARGLKNTNQLRYTNFPSKLMARELISQVQSDYATFLRSIMFDPDFCKQPGIHQRYCQFIEDALQTLKNGAEQNLKLTKEHEESQGTAPFISYELTNFSAEEAPEPESSTCPKIKNQSGRQSCSPDDLKGKAPQRDDDEDGMDGSNGSSNQYLPSTSTSKTGTSGSNSKDSSKAANGASGGPSGDSAVNGMKYEIDNNILNFLLADAIAWNPKQITTPPLPLVDKFSSLAPPRHDVPPFLITYHPLDAPAEGGLPLAVEA